MKEKYVNKKQVTNTYSLLTPNYITLKVTFLTYIFYLQLLNVINTYRYTLMLGTNSNNMKLNVV